MGKRGKWGVINGSQSFSFARCKELWQWLRLIFACGVNIVKDTQLYPSKWFKWLILCYVYFIRKKLGNFCGLSGGKLVAGLRTEQEEVSEMA